MKIYDEKIRLDYKESIRFLKKINSKLDNIEFDRKKILSEKENKDINFVFSPPIIFPDIDERQSLEEYIKDCESEKLNYIIILIRAGQSSLAYVENAKIIYHKTIRKYMVRKKQGKAQITYLGKKGKSKEGSRIRLRNTLLFFEEINEKLSEWFNNNNKEKIRKIYYSCPIRLWSYLFKSKVKPPFEKKDERLIKIPIHIHKPRFKEVKRAKYYLESGFIKEFGKNITYLLES